MVFNHLIKHNGKYYPAGTNVPLEDNTKPTNQKSEYTKSEISRMTTAELQKLANELGIENALETSGSKLKEILAEHFGL